jgi:hypothetical protein
MAHGVLTVSDNSYEDLRPPPPHALVDVTTPHCRAALFKLVQDHWSPSTVYCDESDTEPGFGMVIMTHSFGMATDGPLLRFADPFGAPVHVSSSQLFVAARAQAGAIYAVPDSCVFRLGSSPLQVVVQDALGTLESRAPDRVAAKYVPRSTFRRTEIAVRERQSVCGGGEGTAFFLGMRRAHTHAHTHMHIHTCTPLHTHTHTCTHMHTHAHTRTHITHTHTHHTHHTHTIT